MALQKVRRKAWTYQRYLQIPQDSHRYEIIWGELYVAPAPTTFHQKVLKNLLVILDQHVRSQDLGEVLVSPVDVVLSEHNVFQPDLLFISKERLSIVTDTHIDGPPDLVVEILSPSTADRDRGAKMDAYSSYKVPHYWLIDPRSRTLEVYQLRGDYYALLYQGAWEGAVSPKPFSHLHLYLAELWR